MSDERDPPVHVIFGDQKFNVCLSRAAKFISGIAATVLSALVIGALGFAWSSNETLGRMLTRLDSIEHRFARIDRQMDRLDDKLDGKADK